MYWNIDNLTLHRPNLSSKLRSVYGGGGEYGFVWGYNQKLQTEVSERQQIEQQLEQRATELTISNTGLEQFAYVVSHDLQEPLRAMTAFSQLLEQRYSDQLDSAGKGYVNHIVEGGIRMKAMIDGILELSRIDNQEETQNTPVNLEQTLETVLENLKIICLETQAVITHEALPSLNMIENHGLQLLQNLIVNSIKFRGPEPPRIHITAKQQSKGWLFSIQDNGIGIPKDQQHSLRRQSRASANRFRSSRHPCEAFTSIYLWYLRP